MPKKRIVRTSIRKQRSNSHPSSRYIFQAAKSTPNSTHVVKEESVSEPALWISTRRMTDGSKRQRRVPTTKSRWIYETVGQLSPRCSVDQMQRSDFDKRCAQLLRSLRKSKYSQVFISIDLEQQTKKNTKRLTSWNDEVDVEERREDDRDHVLRSDCKHRLNN